MASYLKHIFSLIKSIENKVGKKYKGANGKNYQLIQNCTKI